MEISAFGGSLIGGSPIKINTATSLSLQTISAIQLPNRG